MLIITLLLGSILVPLSTQVEQRQITEAQRVLDRIRDAILGYAVTFGYLPCPDLTAGAGSNDGQEDVTGSNCTSAEGNLPWATLGVDNADPWGNRYRYRVDTDFTNRTTRFTLTTSADLQVCTAQACAVELTSTTAGNKAVAVILSHGRNGFGAMNATTNAANPAPAGTDELENTDNDTRFVRRPVAGAVGSTAGEFDDIVTWLSKYTVYNRMVAAGKLP